MSCCRPRCAVLLFFFFRVFDNSVFRELERKNRNPSESQDAARTAVVKKLLVYKGEPEEARSAATVVAPKLRRPFREPAPAVLLTRPA